MAQLYNHRYLNERVHHKRSRGGLKSTAYLDWGWVRSVDSPPASNSSVARLIPLSAIKFYDKLSQRVTWEYYGRVRYVTGARRSSLDPKRVSSCCSARTNRVSFQRTKLSFRTSPTKRYRRLLYTCAEHSTGQTRAAGGPYIIFATDADAATLSHYNNINIIYLIYVYALCRDL